MVALGAVMASVSLAAFLLWWRSRALPTHPLLLRALVLAAPRGFLALEAGGHVTEWGRQPFAVRGVLRTAQAVTPSASVQAALWAFAALYLFLAVATGILLWRQIVRAAPARSREGE
jgi:cytochrome d ubiquinol oxidase subunit I